MKLHRNARTCPNSRRLLVDRVIEQSWSITAAFEHDGRDVHHAFEPVEQALSRAVYEQDEGSTSGGSESA